MGRLKRGSKVLEDTNKQTAGLKSIDPNLDLGNSLNMSVLNDLVNETQRKLEAYNTALSNADAAGSDLTDSEKKLSQFMQRMISGVAAKYSKDSIEYEKVGRKRTSEIKRPASRAPKSTKKE